jgi:hypothetical protein
MIILTRYIRYSLIRLALLALVALALFPPGPSRTQSALAQDQPPPPILLPQDGAPAGDFSVLLPLIAGGAAPDLIFTPDSVELSPGAEASVQVRVEPQADLRGATFELPGVQTA